ncbi:hypothetical protein AB0J83_47280 [Actinoplanes sp. NPDC049596]|uniref:hypothetical protein n=1 Tax=unclassified Actinoplanes TaxID=2626549 RepID=UPI00341ABE6E
MPSRRVRLSLALTTAAVSLGGALVFVGFAPAGTTPVSAPVRSVSQSASPSSVAAKLGPATYITSPAPTPTPTSKPAPSPTPDNGIHVDCEKGDDSNKGTLAQPLRSIGAATSREGAVIELARGCTWPATTIQLQGKGTVLTAYGSGALPVIDGGMADADSVVVLTGANQVLENVRVTNAKGNAVEIQGERGAVRSSTIDHAGVGVLLKATGASVDGVTVRDLHMVLDTPGGDDDYGAFGFAVQANGVDIGRSSCTNCRAPSNDYGYDGGFVEVWNYADDLDVHDNTGSNTQGILEIGADRPDSSARGIRLRDNTFRESHGGLVLHTDGTFAIADAEIAVTGNTISSTGSQDPPILDGDLTNVTFDGNTVSTASFVSHSAPASHRCNSITLRGGAEVGYQRDSTEKLGGRSAC